MPPGSNATQPLTGSSSTQSIRHTDNYVLGEGKPSNGLLIQKEETQGSKSWAHFVAGG
jgi:hypothetical protein